ncbi:Transposase-associated domain [Arabidopsis suecica]|uniref:Transposase-associated domain n=1 Tax=Arabidopsis suecica TaxID=45249 RepID=A0A8T1YQI8_ARASU|nr:Transposase-associated domain [Arabidopsis suecica]
MAGNYNYGGNGGYREWIYKRFDEVTGNLSAEYVAGVQEFMTFANSQPIVQSNRGKFHCPCSVCKNEKHMVSGRRVSSHLFSQGFMPDYYVWYRHGEELNMDIGTSYTDRTYLSENHEEVDYVVEDPYVDMVNDAFRYNVGFDDNYQQDGSYQNVEEPVRNHSNKFYDLLEGAQNPLYDGCREGQSQLSLAARLMQNKAEYNMSEKLVDSVCQMFTDFLPEGNQATSSHYQTEKLMRNLGLPYHTIDVCVNNYAAEWRYFQAQNPQFAEEPRNVYLGLCTDGFNPFGMSRNHSLWPVILTPYNLPPGMCMNTEYLFLTILNSGPNHPRGSLDVFLQPLIEELKELWSTGVDAYDVSLNQNFNLKAVLMWTISDFPAYSMLSGWTTHGKLSCPICMESTKSFYLPNGRKTCWFDCHRRFLPHGHPLRRNKKDFLRGKDASKEYPPDSLTGEQVYYERLVGVNPPRTKDVGGNGHEKKMAGYGKEHNWHKESILWELPYWKDLNLRHNIDVMHTEKNFLDNIMNTLIGVKGKSKDNIMSRLDVEKFCSRPELHIDRKGKAPFPAYTLTNEAKKSLLECVKNAVKFPDGYSSDLATCVDMENGKFSGMKSHDCHVFMERLLPFIFAELLDRNVHLALSEKSSPNSKTEHSLNLMQLGEDISGVSDGASRPWELTAEECTLIFLQSTDRDSRGNPYGVGSLKDSIVNGTRKHPGDTSSFRSLQEQLKEAQQKIEEQAAREAQQKDKLDNFSMVEKYLRQTDPQFLNWIANHSAQETATAPLSTPQSQNNQATSPSPSGE